MGRVPFRRARPRGDNVSSRSCLTVLVVDDDRLFRELFVRFIASRYPAAAVLEAGSLEEARARILEQRPHVALIDVCLPDGKGFALVEELRRDAQEVTVAVCTSYDIDEYRDAATRSGASCFITKGALKVDDIDAVLAEGLGRLQRQEREASSP